MATEFVEKKRSLFFGLPLSVTKYTIKEDVLTINTGLVSQQENDCYMYKIQDVQLKTSLMERIFKLGTVLCYTGDTTNPVIELKHVRSAKEIKNFILKYSEEARLKRRTVATMNIGAGLDSDGDGIPDYMDKD